MNKSIKLDCLLLAQTENGHDKWPSSLIKIQTPLDYTLEISIKAVNYKRMQLSRYRIYEKQVLSLKKQTII